MATIFLNTLLALLLVLAVFSASSTDTSILDNESSSASPNVANSTSSSGGPVSSNSSSTSSQMATSSKGPSSSSGLSSSSTSTSTISPALSTTPTSSSTTVTASTITSTPTSTSASTSTSTPTSTPNSSSSSPSPNSTSHLTARSPPKNSSFLIQLPSALNNPANVTNGRRIDDDALERAISGEDISNNEDGEQREGESINYSGREWNGTVFGRGELPMLPAHLSLPVQKQAPSANYHPTANESKPGNGSSIEHFIASGPEDGQAKETLAGSTIRLSKDAQNSVPIQSTGDETNGTDSDPVNMRRKRDEVSDAINRLKESVSNVQQQIPNSDGSISSAFLPNMGGASMGAGKPNETQIIQIPPIDLSGKAQNIILVSDTGNVTLSRGNGFVYVSTFMMQPPPQQSPKN